MLPAEVFLRRAAAKERQQEGPRGCSYSERPRRRNLRRIGVRRQKDWSVFPVGALGTLISPGTASLSCTTTSISWWHYNMLFSLSKHNFLWECGKKQGTTSGKNVCFLKGLEQTWFCGTLGNRSERLSSGKLWANINEAFKLEKKEEGRKGRHTWSLQQAAWGLLQVGQATVRLCVTVCEKIALTIGLKQRPLRVPCTLQSGFLKH